MQLTFTGHNINLTDPLKQFASEKIKKLERHFERITSIHLVFSVEKIRQIAEANVAIAKGTLHAKAEADDLYNAIDLLVDKLDKQLLKFKGKIKNHRE